MLISFLPIPDYECVHFSLGTFCKMMTGHEDEGKLDIEESINLSGKCIWPSPLLALMMKDVL